MDGNSHLDPADTRSNTFIIISSTETLRASLTGCWHGVVVAMVKGGKPTTADIIRAKMAVNQLLVTTEVWEDNYLLNIYRFHER